MLEPDRDQLEIFISALFCRAGSGGYVSLRSFLPDSKVLKPIRAVVINGDGSLVNLVDVAEDQARRAANNQVPAVFCPPIAVFNSREGWQAREQDLYKGLALSVECDEHADEARWKLEEILGPATVVVRSGGVWLSEGGLKDKLHLHWRLNKPAENADAFINLKQARRLATAIAGADPTNIPAVHCLRWPGSWHRKGEPRLCEIFAVNPDAEIDLGTALAALKAAAPPVPQRNTTGSTTNPEDWNKLTSDLLAGHNLHSSIARLAARYIKSGMSAGATVNQLRSLMDNSAARQTRPGEWQARRDDIARAVSSAEEKYAAAPAPEEEQAAQPEFSSTSKGKAFGYSWQWAWHGETEIKDSRPCLVQDLLPQTGVGLISGQWGTYKTFVANDLAASVMTGTSFINFPVVRKGGVLFFACEGQSEVAIRLTAAFEAKGGSGKAPFAWVENSPRLLDPNASKILAAMVKQAAEKMQADFGLAVALVIVDTAGKAAGLMKTGDLNDDASAKIIMKALADASTETGALFVGVAHFGKNVEVGTKGSSGFEDDADAVLALLGDKGINGVVDVPRLCVRKRRAGPNGQEFPFRTTVVDMGPDSFGAPITTLTIRWPDASEAEAMKMTGVKKPADAWGAKSLRLLRQALMNMLADCGSEQRPHPDGPTVRAVDIEIVRAEFYKSHPASGDDKAQARKKAFKRAVEDARDKGLIGSRDIGALTFVWIADPLARA